jgi:hypothetical protein
VFRITAAEKRFILKRRKAVSSLVTKVRKKVIKDLTDMVNYGTAPRALITILKKRRADNYIKRHIKNFGGGEISELSDILIGLYNNGHL